MSAWAADPIAVEKALATSKVLASLFALLVTTAGCATNPATGQHQFSLLSEEEEINAGRENDVQIRRDMGLYADRTIQEAFALRGGYVYVTRGILPFLEDESQLAGVLGHEIRHVTARHAVQRYSKAAGAQLGNSGFGVLFVNEPPRPGERLKIVVGG